MATQLNPAPGRREFLRVGALGGLGLSLSQLLGAQAAGVASRADACIVLFLTAGRAPRHMGHEARGPGDIIATLYHLLGVDPEMNIHDVLARPSPFVPRGRVLNELFS